MYALKKITPRSILLLFVFLAALFFILSQNSKTDPAQLVFQLTEKPSIQSVIVSNAELVFNESGWISPTSEDLLLAPGRIKDTGSWKGNAYYSIDSTTLGIDESIIIAHPISETEPRYLEQDIFLPDKKDLYVVIGIRNVGKKTSSAECTDNIFIVVVKDENGTRDILAEIIVEDTGEWLHYALDVSRFQGKKVTLRLESWAGGPCDTWNGEWGLVDYIDVIDYTPELPQ